jgi:hypothetical protein
MSLLLALALLAPGNVTADCSWDHPGANRYTGDPVAAVDHYNDIPPDIRAALKQRIAARKSDDIVTIRRDSVDDGNGKYAYDPVLRDMHFGSGSVCSTVSRAKWAPRKVERALVYCEKDQCIIVPAICGNVSRITRRPGLALIPPTELPIPFNPIPVIPVTPEQMATLLVPAPYFYVPDRDDDEERDLHIILPPMQQTAALPPIGGDDRVPLAPVPEAQSWAMLLAGLGLIGAAIKRRRP